MSLLLVLLAILLTLVLLENLFVSRIGASHCYDPNSGDGYNRSKHKLAPRQQAEDRFRGDIIVLEYENLQECQNEQGDGKEDNTVNSRGNKWSQQQIEEMDKYYRRYLEVFYEKNGKGYVPEDKETVYTEYLAFLDRKAKARDKQKQTVHSENVETESPTQDEPKKDVQEEVHDDNKTSTVESHKFQSSPVRDNAILKHDPYYLGMDWEDFDEVGGDLFSLSNNYTETMTTAPTPTTLIVVGGRTYSSDATTISQSQPGQSKGITL